MVTGAGQDDSSTFPGNSAKMELSDSSIEFNINMKNERKRKLNRIHPFIFPTSTEAARVDSGAGEARYAPG
jgi:hypothetical protein